MSFRKSWQPIPEVGELCLQKIGQENALWHQYKRNSDIIKTRADLLGEGIGEMVERVLDEAMAEGSLTDLDRLSERFSDRQLHDIACAFVAGEAASRIGDVENGGSQFVHQKRARLTVLRYGVYKCYTDPNIQPSDRPSEALEIEHQEIGVVNSLRSLPPFGGVLKFKGFIDEKRIYGLVNPATGEPLVRLEILERR